MDRHEYDLTDVERQLTDYLQQQGKVNRELSVEEIVREVYGKEIRITDQNFTRFKRDVFDVLDGLQKKGLVTDTTPKPLLRRTRTERMEASRWKLKQDRGSN